MGKRVNRVDEYDWRWQEGLMIVCDDGKLKDFV